jgi:hypothetical protein
MSYSPTEYRASTRTPSASSRFFSAIERIAMSAAGAPAALAIG